MTPPPPVRSAYGRLGASTLISDGHQVQHMRTDRTPQAASRVPRSVRRRPRGRPWRPHLRPLRSAIVDPHPRHASDLGALHQTPTVVWCPLGRSTRPGLRVISVVPGSAKYVRRRTRFVTRSLGRSIRWLRFPDVPSRAIRGQYSFGAVGRLRTASLGTVATTAFLGTDRTASDCVMGLRA